MSREHAVRTVLLLGMLAAPAANGALGDWLKKGAERVKGAVENAEQAMDSIQGTTTPSQSGPASAQHAGQLAEVCAQKAENNPAFNGCAVTCASAAKYLQFQSTGANAQTLAGQCQNAYQQAVEAEEVAKSIAGPMNDKGSGPAGAPAAEAAAGTGEPPGEKSALIADIERMAAECGNFSAQMKTAQICSHTCNGINQFDGNTDHLSEQQLKIEWTMCRQRHQAFVDARDRFEQPGALGTLVVGSLGDLPAAMVTKPMVLRDGKPVMGLQSHPGHDDLPVEGFQPWADAMTLALDPNALAEHPQRTQNFIRNTFPGGWSAKYLAASIHGGAGGAFRGWKGSTEFDGKRSFDSFVAEESGWLLEWAQSVNPEYFSFSKFTVGQYDHGQQEFGIHNYGVTTRLPSPLGGPAAASALPQLPKTLSMSSGEAEAFLQRLPADREAYLLIGLRLVPIEGPSHTRALIRMTSAELYADAGLTKRILVLDDWLAAADAEYGSMVAKLDAERHQKSAHEQARQARAEQQARWQSYLSRPADSVCARYDDSNSADSYDIQSVKIGMTGKDAHFALMCLGYQAPEKLVRAPAAIRASGKLERAFTGHLTYSKSADGSTRRIRIHYSRRDDAIGETRVNSVDYTQVFDQALPPSWDQVKASLSAKYGEFGTHGSSIGEILQFPSLKGRYGDVHLTSTENLEKRKQFSMRMISTLDKLLEAAAEQKANAGKAPGAVDI